MLTYAGEFGKHLGRIMNMPAGTFKDDGSLDASENDIQTTLTLKLTTEAKVGGSVLVPMLCVGMHSQFVISVLLSVTKYAYLYALHKLSEIFKQSINNKLYGIQVKYIFEVFIINI